ncbi:MAG: DMT family transporter, partial [Muribaculaceae bacterium]|nr:DMT family transporter [Muribaculaceae bacterium]
ISRPTAACMAVALTGILLLCKPSGDATLSLTGVILSILSGLTYAIYIVAANRPRFQKMPTLKMLFYVLIFGTMVFASRLFVSGTLVLPTCALDWVCVTCLALLPTAISFGCTTLAIQKIGSTPTAILGALEPVTALLVAFAVFGESVSSRETAGIILILVAVSFVAAGKDAAGALIRIRKMFPRAK